ncbi:THUMP domain protein [Methanothermus fervidus DSM 2088]|uniref:THUMP domain protein n=1 Tax=Methanothermus fervidus (strain ATCC 43054 / DSM 2088 / JCM 10308 / V24 S) TaxID=523846 RepID=E3GWV1_METFV|nr:SPOUT family RNA methylase [Methanothermus fervidus]ADP78020.1 THUMP domain protein [Methanothermus fervidus DSM 2088]
MKFLITTPRGLEGTAANYIKEKIKDADVWITPMGYAGLVLVKTKENCEKQLKEIPEVERVIPVMFEVPAKLDEILSTAKNISKHINETETFSVETTRRGKHEFTSMDVNIKLGRKIEELTGADVNLTLPDKKVLVEIIGDKAYISVIEREKWKKYTPEKPDARSLLKKITIVQLPYWGDYKVCRKMGEKIGRAAQAFEIKELIISPKEKMDAYELMEFIRGVKKGQRSRYLIQKDAYPWDVRKIPVSVWDLYQVIRDKRRKNRTIIITDPLGDIVSNVKNKLKKDLKFSKEIIVFIGSREGIPRGLFDLADYVLDLTPHMTFATEQGIPAILILLWHLYESS